MRPIEIPTIELQARALRALDLQNSRGLFAERLRLCALLLSNSIDSLLRTMAESLRPVFSWNPQQVSDKMYAARGIRINRLARRLFAWNPQAQRHS